MRVKKDAYKCRGADGKFPEKDDFPFEAFVQRMAERYFQKQGFQILKEIPFLDVHAKRGGEEWKIECKGKTSQIGLDFNTGLGQIFKKMDDENTNYALAMPDIPSFRKQASQVPERVRKILKLHWIWVKENGEIEMDIPLD
jgi:hypothetical protein